LGGLASSAQQWAPIGAKWYYDERFAFSGMWIMFFILLRRTQSLKGRIAVKFLKVMIFIVWTDHLLN